MPVAERANAGLHPHVIDRVLQQVPDREARILDLGCGSGSMLGRLARLGYRRLHGIDISLPAEPTVGVSFSEADLDSPVLPFEAESLDLVLCVEVIEHMENPGHLLKEIARVLHPCGRLLITTPNVHSIEARLRLLLLGELKQFDRIGDPTHIAPIFNHPFALLLHRHGLQAEQSWGYPLDGGSPTSRPALRALAGMLKLFGLKGTPAGDQLCG
jgi:2-polyprenyl-3-methyl-5-hydroxy-6-metoxy-1,4-benzoquinol methylase